MLLETSILYVLIMRVCYDIIILFTVYVCLVFSVRYQVNVCKREEKYLSSSFYLCIILYVMYVFMNVIYVCMYVSMYPYVCM